MSKIIVILGQTASGKSSLAVKLAKKFNGEIISADSRQVYKGLDIGTGKITKKEMGGVTHYLLDVADPKKTFTVQNFQKLGNKAIKKILAKGKVPIICGGTGFYIDALIYDYKLPNIKPDKKLRKNLESKSAEELFLLLKKSDPRRAGEIDRFNKRRLIRALEIIKTTGKQIPTAPLKISRFDILKIGIKKDDKELSKLIHDRLIKRMGQGLVGEGKKLQKNGLSFRRMEELGLEYRYLARYLQGKLTKEQMINELENEIKKYAKRQMTWFKRDQEIRWVKKASQAENAVKKFLKTKNPR